MKNELELFPNFPKIFPGCIMPLPFWLLGNLRQAAEFVSVIVPSSWPPGAPRLCPHVSHTLWLFVGQMWTPKAAQKRPKKPGNFQEVQKIILLTAQLFRISSDEEPSGGQGRGKNWPQPVLLDSRRYCWNRSKHWSNKLYH